MNNFENAETILIPKGRDMQIVLNWIEEQGFEPPTPPSEGNKALVGRVGDRRYGFLRSNDIPSMLNRGMGDVGFVGSDKIDELQTGGQFTNLTSETIADAGCTLVAEIGKDADGIGDRIATPFPNLTQRWALDFSKFRGYAPNIVFAPTGSTEAFIGLGFADTVVDLKETGQTIADNGLAVAEEIMPITTKMLWRDGAREAELNPVRLYGALKRISAQKRPFGSVLEDRWLWGATTTTKLFNSRNELVKKIGSEAAEFIQDLVEDDPRGMVLEAQDLIYAMAVALCAKDKSLIDALNLL